MRDGKEVSFIQRNPFGDGCIFCARYMEEVKALGQVIKVRRAEVIEQKCALSLEDAKELFNFREDGTMEINTSASAVPFGGFRGPPNACKEGKLEEEELPAWTKKMLARSWKHVSEDHEAPNGIMRSVMWKSTDSCNMRLEKSEEKGTITLTYMSVSTVNSSLSQTSGGVSPRTMENRSRRRRKNTARVVGGVNRVGSQIMEGSEQVARSFCRWETPSANRSSTQLTKHLMESATR